MNNDKYEAITIEKADTTATPLYFSRWLKNQRNRNDRVGDLARDAVLDESFPKRRTSLSTYTRHLEKHNACAGARESLEQAWSEWQADTTAATVASNS